MGPFEIVEKKSPIAYKLALPPSLSKMHDVFHVSFLRKYVVDPSHVLYLFDLQMLNPHIVKFFTIRVLTFRTTKLRNQEINECLVQWEKYFE